MCGLDDNRSKLLTATVGGLAYGGEFICEVSTPEILAGKKAFVRGVAPGEVIQAEVLKEKERYLHAKLLKVINARNERVVAACKYYSKCGGCDLQHIEIESQREIKLKMVETMLERQAKVKPQNGVELLGSKLSGYSYKRRVTLHLNQSGQIGFYKKKTREIVSINECLIATDKINKAIVLISKHSMLLSKFFSEIFIEEIEDKPYLAFIVPKNLKPNLKELTSTLKRLKDFPSFRVLHKGSEILTQSNFNLHENNPFPVACFSQGNSEGNKALVDCVLSNISETEVTDLYAGAGNFSLPLAQAGCRVNSVDLEHELIEFAKKKAFEQNLSESISFHCMSCADYIKRNKLTSTVLLDPPRTGASEVVKTIDPNTVKKIVYVSCNLPTLCRDLNYLVRLGYTLQKVYFIDMFAQTHHVETVSILDCAK